MAEEPEQNLIQDIEAAIDKDIPTFNNHQHNLPLGFRLYNVWVFQMLCEEYMSF